MRTRLTRIIIAAVLALTFAFGIAGSAGATHETCIVTRVSGVICFVPRT